MRRIWTEEENSILIEKYLVYGLDYCVEYLNRSKRAVEERRKKLKIPTRTNIISKYRKDNLILIVKTSNNYLECLDKLGITNKGSSYNTLKKYIKEYGISVDHFIKVNNSKKKNH